VKTPAQASRESTDYVKKNFRFSTREIVPVMLVQVSILMCLILVKEILVFVDLACIPPSIRTAGVPGPARKNVLCAVGGGTSAGLTQK
jgi:hypothetical protein